MLIELDITLGGGILYENSNWAQMQKMDSQQL